MKYTLATAIAALLLPLPEARAQAQRAPARSDTVLWIIPGLREPRRSLLTPPPPPVPSVRLGRARIPLTRFLSPLAGFPVEAAPVPDWTASGTLRFGALGRPIGYLDIPEARARSPGLRDAPAPGRFVNEYADLGFSLRGTGEIGGDWTAFRPCDETVQVTCEVSLLPQITPDIRFAATADGTITDRILVDVDYDQTREFQGANRLNIHYQGLPGEILQRFEVGDVRFDLSSSRFLREAVPAGNFGFQATLRAGPVDVRSVWAQQAGEVTSRRFRLEGSGRGYSRSDTLVLDDADYLEGQFFFLFDPAAFRDYPHIDILALSRADAAPTATPGAEPIQLYRSEIDLYARQQVEGYIQADAVAGAGADSVTESAWFQYLRPGQDYVVHPSGLWVALRVPLGPDEILGVTYVTEAGDTVGTYNPERIYRAGGRPRLRMLKATSAQHQPGRPTWRTEMHQVYRVTSSGDVDPGSVELSISLGEESAGRTFARRPNGDDLTYLRLFGLDEESPSERLDESQIYRPALDSFEDQPPVQGTFIVFPTLEPFAAPAPLRSVPIDTLEAQRILGANRNGRIYRDPDPFERENGGVFRLNLSYQVQGAGTVSSFALGAVGIREGTERVTLADRVLLGGVDYTIDYDAGLLTLLNPEALLAANPGRFLDVSWEQRSFFQVAPSSVFGLNAGYEMGDYGAVNLVGLYQTEHALVRRPQLGVEAGAVALGGVNANLNLGAPLLSRLLDAVPGLDVGGESSFRLSGEAAVSLPDPNTQGDVYIDDYDGLNARTLSLQSHEWRRGSAAAFQDGAEGVLPPLLSTDNLAEMTWQHTWIREDVGGDSLGVFQGFNPNIEIDQQIRATGSVLREPGLFVRFRPTSGDVAGERGWSSVTTVLSPTGSDLTKSDFIEFYVRDGDFLSLVLDLGIVSEDAFFADTTGAVRGRKAGSGVLWGLGLLDQEADPRRGEVWGTVTDGRGVWDEDCFAERARVYRLGDPNANCTRGNGRPDSEDLDEDGNLDTLERYRRFVITLDGNSPFLVRDRHETGTDFRLYRVPVRDPAAIDVGGPVSDAELRAVRHLRLTVTGGRADSFVLARMAIVGSTWIKRSATGVLTGLGGSEASFSGRVEVSPVSKLTVGEDYASPPGVIEQLDDPTAAIGGQGVEFNERSLSVRFEDVPAGDRVEVYNRFPQRPRDFLSYREARLWAVAANGDFGSEVPVYFYVRIGTDDRNFYMYRTRLELADTPGRVHEGDWVPEVVIHFDEWLMLRREAEERLIRDPPRPGDAPLVLWSADSTYSVVLQERGRAPNLASVREMSLGVLNETGGPVSGEFWVDELRLSRGFREAGLVSAVDAELRGGEFLHSRATVRSRGGYFRQLRGTPTYQNDQSLDVSATVQLARLAPSAWRLQLPLSVTYERDLQSPLFLGRSDVRADRLEGLRDPGFDRTRVDLSLRRAAPEGGGAWDAVLAGLQARAGWVRSSLRTITTESEGDGVDAFLGYSIAPPRRDLPLFQGPLDDALRAVLPSFLEERIAGARLRWTPESLRVDGEVTNRELSTLRFDRIVRSPEDSLAAAAQAPLRTVTATAGVTFRPLESVVADASLLSGRDLLEVEELASDAESRELLDAARRRMAGLDLGWEVDRHVRTRLAFQPRLSDWASTSVQVTTIYYSERNPDLIATRHTPGDTALVLLRNVDGQRNYTAAFSLDPRQMGGAGAVGGGRWWTYLDPLRLTYTGGITSRFNRDAVEPGTLYELGWGRRDDFLLIGADSASTLSERDRVQLRGGFRLPGATTIRTTYDRTLNQTLDTRSGREVLQRVWPDLAGTVGDMPLPPFLAPAVTRLSLGSGYRRERRGLDFGAGNQQDRFREDHAVPLSMGLSLVSGVVVDYRGRLGWGESLDPTGDTRRRRDSHSLAATITTRSPVRAFRDRGAPLRITLSLRYLEDVQCRVTSRLSPCVAFIDELERDGSLSVDSTVRDFQLGVRIRYLDRRSFVGQRAGSTQLQLNVFGQFVLTSALLSNGVAGR
ncbi:MAG: hypothetical protein OXF01_15765 [Gemmatimonadetes bacterium]|nr:hypothetical protein [Gemmatimonadota bacterium]